jgi:hypothetical protein
MLRPFLALSAFALAASPAAAATYSAKTTAPAAAKIAARDVLWVCSSHTCTGTTPNSRPLVLCQGLAKQAGRIESFLVDGRDLSASDLERCNASAKADGKTAVANAR